MRSGIGTCSIMSSVIGRDLFNNELSDVQVFNNELVSDRELINNEINDRE